MKYIKYILYKVFFTILQTKMSFGLGHFFTFGILALGLLALVAPLSEILAPFNTFLASIGSDYSMKTEHQLNIFGDLYYGLDNMLSWCKNKIFDCTLMVKDTILFYATIVGIVFPTTVWILSFIIDYKNNKMGGGNAPSDIHIDLFIFDIGEQHNNFVGQTPIYVFAVILKAYIESIYCYPSFLSDLEQCLGSAWICDLDRVNYQNDYIYMLHLLVDSPSFFVDLYLNTVNGDTKDHTLYIIRRIYEYSFKRNL